MRESEAATESVRPSPLKHLYKRTKNTMSTEQPQSNRLYVGNIPWSTTVEELQGLFTDAENIEIPTVRFLLSFFFCFYNFDSIALVWETKKNFSRADDSFFHRRLNALSLRNLSAKPPHRSPKSAENKERDFARRERNAGGKVLRGHSYCKRERKGKESEMR